MKIFTLLFSAAIVLMPGRFFGSANQAAPAAQPNIIYILTDDLGYGDLGKFYQDARNDNRKFDTPYIDQMADEGMMLTNHYVAAPVCAPSRASLLQGLHQGHADIRDNEFDKELPDDINLQNVLKKSGYQTYHVGKYGLAGAKGSALDGHPLKVGFDKFFGYLFHADGHDHYPRGDSNGIYLHEDLTDIVSGTENVYTTDIFTAKAKKYIADHTTQAPGDPFFLYLSYDCPHAKMQIPTQAYPAGLGLNGGLQWTGAGGATPYVNTASGTPDSWIHPDYSGTSWTNMEKRFATMMRRIDTSVGDIMQLLKDLGIDNNTLVVFTSDNGPHYETGHDPRSFRSFAGMDGIKRDLWEAGIRVPTVVRQPTVVPANSSSAVPSGHWDWLPTFADLAQMDIPAKTDGTSLLPILNGSSTTLDREYLYFEYYYGGNQKTPGFTEFEASHRGAIRRQMQAIIMDDLKGVRYNIFSHNTDFRIYDVMNDPKESIDMAVANPSIQQEMKDQILRSRRATPNAPRPYDNALIPDVTANPIQGLAYKYFEGNYMWIPDFEDMQELITGPAYLIDLNLRQRNDNFGLYFEGYLSVPTDGTYTFYSQSQAPVHVMLHDIHLFNNDWNFTNTELSHSLPLEAGLHPIRVFYRHENQPNFQFDLKYEGPNIAKMIIPSDAFYSDDLFLPVEVVDFNAQKIGDEVQLKWTTQTEVNNDYFAIERSNNALNFKTLSTTPSNKNSTANTYYDIDPTPEQGLNYYRLKQVDLDGTATYSDVVAVNFEYSTEGIFPNPTKGIFHINNTTDGDAYEITDLNGRVILRGITTAEHTNVSIAHLPNGVYILNVGDASVKVLKQ